MLIVRSPVRISFGGGGTDLPAYYQQYGGVVVSAAINKYFYTILGTRTDQSIQIISSDLRICEGWRDFAALEFRVRCFNVLKTLTSYLHQPLSKQALAERAFHVARNVLGR